MNFDFEIKDNGEIQNVNLKDEYSTDGKTLKPQYVNKKNIFNFYTGEMLDEVSNNDGSLKFTYRKKLFLKDNEEIDEEKFNVINGKYVLKREFFNIENDEIYYYFNSDDGTAKNVLGKYDSEGKIQLNSNEMKYYNNKSMRKVIDEYFDDTTWALKEEFTNGEIFKKNDIGKDIKRYILKKEHRGDENIYKYYDENDEKVESEFDENKNFPKDYAPSIFHYINFNGELKEPFKGKFFKNDEKFNFNSFKFKDNDGTIKTLASILYSDYSKRIKNTSVFDLDDDGNVVYKSEKLLGHLYYKSDIQQLISESKKTKLEQKMRKFSLYTFKTDLKFKDGDKVTLNYSFANCPYQANLKKLDFMKNYDKLLTTYVDLKYSPEIINYDRKKLEEKYKVIDEYENKLDNAINNEFIFSKDLSGLTEHFDSKINDNNSNYEIDVNELKSLLDNLVKPVDGKNTLQQLVINYKNLFLDSGNQKFRIKHIFNNHGVLESDFIDENGNLKKEYRPKKHFNGLGELNNDLSDEDGNLKKKYRPRKVFEKDENGEYKYLEKVNGNLKLKNEIENGILSDEEKEELFENNVVKDQYMDENVNDLKEIYIDEELATLYDDNGVLKNQFNDGNNKLKFEFNDLLIRDYFNSNGELKEDKILLYDEKYLGIGKFINIRNGEIDDNKVAAYTYKVDSFTKLKAEYREPKGYFDKNEKGEYKYIYFDNSEKKLKIRNDLTDEETNYLKDFNDIKDTLFENGSLKESYYNNFNTDIDEKYINSPITKLFDENGSVNHNLFNEEEGIAKMKSEEFDNFIKTLSVDILKYERDRNAIKNQFLTELSNMCMHILKLEDYDKLPQHENFVGDTETFNDMIKSIIKSHPSNPKMKQLKIEYEKRRNHYKKK